jgi:hypothetical protein
MKPFILLFIAGLLLVSAVNIHAQQLNRNVPAPSPNDEKYPAPPDNPNRLFYVQRTPNSNTIVYDLNEKNGKLDPEAPIHVYWVRLTNKGEHEELTYIQRKFAYGLNFREINAEQFDVRFSSYKKFPLTLMKGADGKFHIFATIDQKQMILSRIFVKIIGGTRMLPNVLYAELKGTDPVTGKEITERFKP